VILYPKQVSVKMALRRKFKQCRQPLCSTQTVADCRAKFGRPGVSGRKRKVADGEPQSTPDTLCKKKRTDMVIICCNLVCTEF